MEFEEKLSCIKCNPDENTDCIVVDEHTNATECTPTTIGYNNTCYTYQNGSSSVRGCLYEASELIFNECKLELAACISCNQSDCNRTPLEDLMPNPSPIEGKTKTTEATDPNDFLWQNNRMFQMCSAPFCNNKKLKLLDANIDEDPILSSLDLALSAQEDSNTSEDMKVRRLCYGCSSKEDPNCVNRLSIEMVGGCPHSDEDLGCYHLKTGTK